MTITLTTFRHGFILLPFLPIDTVPTSLTFGWLSWVISLSGEEDEEWPIRHNEMRLWDPIAAPPHCSRR